MATTALRELAVGARFRTSYGRKGKVEYHSPSGTTVRWEGSDRTVALTDGRSGRQVEFVAPARRELISSGTVVEALGENDSSSS